ncbi:hypothetical protein L1049_016343 [Liquidambar formosana]|uniref:pectinesterase n=1 Tax=Liquidambar formosana TaxID=63359 RepID=A0AAP0S5P6_LIQFO
MGKGICGEEEIPFHSNNSQWVCIQVKAGVYREKLTISANKPYIMIKGEGKRRTKVVWDDHASVAQSPTLMVLADNFIAKCISFTNSYNYPWNNGNPRVPAVAAMIAGDKCSFYRCGFFGLQDTLWDFQGRHYFKLCTIEGVVDFIFGTGQSIYERCVISVIGEALDPNSPGFITAQGRTNENDPNGFVFKDCNVIGQGLTYLGRPWRDYARGFSMEDSGSLGPIISPSSNGNIIQGVRGTLSTTAVWARLTELPIEYYDIFRAPSTDG